jgi:hypothetical protein
MKAMHNYNYADRLKRLFFSITRTGIINISTYSNEVNRMILQAGNLFS